MHADGDLGGGVVELRYVADEVYRCSADGGQVGLVGGVEYLRIESGGSVQFRWSFFSPSGLSPVFNQRSATKGVRAGWTTKRAVEGRGASFSRSEI